MSISCSLKQTLAKGFTLLGGGKYDTKKGHSSYEKKTSLPALPCLSIPCLLAALCRVLFANFGINV